MGRHLLIYDVDWWILGKHAKVIQRHHPDLYLMSIQDLDRYLEQHSSEELNQAYDRTCAMCLGIAAYCIFKHIRIDASAAVSYYYFSQNYETYREWTNDELIPDPEFLRLVIPRVGVIGAMNERLSRALQVTAPQADVQYIGHFVDHRLFRPLDTPRSFGTHLVVGWAGILPNVPKIIIHYINTSESTSGMMNGSGSWKQPERMHMKRCRDSINSWICC